MFLTNLSNAIFFWTVAFGAGAMFFEHKAFIGLYIGLGTLFILLELKRLTVRSVLFYSLIILAIVVLAIKALFGFTIAKSMIVSLAIGAGLANAMVHGRIRPKTARSIFYMITVYLIYQMLIGTDPNELFKASRNAVSSYAISSLMILVFLYRQRQIAPPILPALICMILSIWAIGRSGIISSLSIFIAMLFASNISLTSKPSKILQITTKVMCISFGIIIVLVIWNNSIANTESYLSYFIARGLSDEVRKEIIIEYLHYLTPSSAILGLELQIIPSINFANNDPHNSFIMLHAYLGLLGFIMFALITFHLISEFIHGNFIYGTIVLGYLLRISTDSEVGITVFTFIFLTLTFNGVSDLLLYSTLKYGKKIYPVEPVAS